MNDCHLRFEMRERLTSLYGNRPNTLILEELGLRHGATRVDMAVVNGRLEGFELKSERDSLARLARQAQIFSTVLDRVTLVAAKTHVSAALTLIPTWWGVVAASYSSSRRLRLVQVRPAEDNPAVDSIALAKLLWRSEALRLLEIRNEDDGIRSAKRAVLYERIAVRIPQVELKARVRENLRARKGWRAGAQ